jgi:hypothetical protein
MDIPNKAEGERKAIAHPLETVIQGRHIVRNLLHIIQRDAGRLRVLIEKQVRERRLRALNLGGENSFFTNVGIEKELEVRKSGGHSVQPSHSLVCLSKDGL